MITREEALNQLINEIQTGEVEWDVRKVKIALSGEGVKKQTELYHLFVELLNNDYFEVETYTLPSSDVCKEEVEELFSGVNFKLTIHRKYIVYNAYQWLQQYGETNIRLLNRFSNLYAENLKYYVKYGRGLLNQIMYYIFPNSKGYAHIPDIRPNQVFLFKPRKKYRHWYKDKRREVEAKILKGEIDLS